MPAGEGGSDQGGAGAFRDDINRYLAGAFLSNSHSLIEQFNNEDVKQLDIVCPKGLLDL